MNKHFFITIVLLLCSILYAQVNLTQSLTACYSLDGNAADPINNLTGTLSAATPTLDRFNNPSSALAFNGTPGSIVRLPDDPLLKPTNGFSFSGWMKTSLVSTQYILMTRDVATSNFESYDLHFQVQGGLKLCGKKGVGNGQSTIVTGTTNLNTDTWYHFVLTVDNNNISVYTNGNLDATSTVTFGFNYLSNKTIILGGSDETSFNLPFTGSMDNLRFYNRVINMNEISELYSTDPRCIEATSVFQNSRELNGIKISPNPSTGILRISSNDELDEIQVYDLLGNLLLSEIDNKKQVDLSTVPSGIYFIKVKINDGIYTQKIIKE